MKRTLLIVLLVSLPLLSSLSLAVAEDAVPKSVDTIADTIKVEAVSDYIANNQDAVILDVRTPQEFETSHVPGAVNINILHESFVEAVGQLDSDKTYIVYCTKNPAGGRSMTALAKMKEMGFKELISLEGGHVAWTEAHLPISTKDKK